VRPSILFLAFLIGLIGAASAAFADEPTPSKAAGTVGGVPIAPVSPAVPQPATLEDATGSGATFYGALKAKRWWFAVAVGIFLVMFALSLFGVWEKFGTKWAWVSVGVLSLAAGTFAAFDEKGFNVTTLLSYMTAGPTVAWLRDWVKDGWLKLRKKE